MSRIATIPDPFRVARAQRAPEYGPNLLFLSGGSALRPLSRMLKRYTHNSIHLITPFDSGGSSAVLRRTFDMLAVGDLRNRLMALADETSRGNPAIYALFAHRFAFDADPEDLRAQMEAMVRGDHPLVAPVPTPMRRIVRTHFRVFLERMPPDFDLRGASIGNLILTAGYLHNDGDIDSVVYLFSKLVEVRGTVLPTVDADLHLAAHFADGDRVVGQHRFTGKHVPPVQQRIEKLTLVTSLDDPQPAEVGIHRKITRLINKADIVIYPFGSFWSSVVANLLPRGVGRALTGLDCPKIYLPNTGRDPEQHGMTLADSVEAILDAARTDAGDTPAERILTAVVIDPDAAAFELPLDTERVRALGVPVIDADLAGPNGHYDPEKITAALLSLA